MKIAIRRATADDFDAAIAIWRHANLERRGKPLKNDYGEALQARLTSTSRHWLLVAESGGAMLGIVMGGPARALDGVGDVIPGLCHISMMSVDPLYWRLGIARRLMIELLNQAREARYTSMQLWTHASNAGAQKLYESLGFTRTERTKTDDNDEEIVLYSQSDMGIASSNSPFLRR